VCIAPVNDDPDTNVPAGLRPALAFGIVPIGILVGIDIVEIVLGAPPRWLALTLAIGSPLLCAVAAGWLAYRGDDDRRHTVGWAITGFLSYLGWAVFGIVFISAFGLR
jgi:hypothetical protein